MGSWLSSHTISRSEIELVSTPAGIPVILGAGGSGVVHLGKMRRKQSDGTSQDIYVAVKTVLSAKKAVEEAHSSRFSRKSKQRNSLSRERDSGPGRSSTSSTSAQHVKLSEQVSEEELASLGREMAILQQLSDDHIVRFYGGNKDEVMLVMEYVDGGDLAQCLQEQDPVVRWENRGRHIIQTIADTVAKLHCSGFVHRDLKPSNVLLTCDYVVKLTDVGSAVRLFRAAQKQDQGPDPIGSMVDGITPFYAAPECFKRGVGPSEAMDVFSLGIMLWELWNHQLIQKELIDDIPSAVAGMPDDLASLLSAALDTDPNQRPTARDFAQRLQQCRGDRISNLNSHLDPSRRSFIVAFNLASTKEREDLRRKYSSAFGVLIDTAECCLSAALPASTLSSFTSAMKALEVSQICSVQLKSWIDQFAECVFESGPAAWEGVFDLLSSESATASCVCPQLFRYILTICKVVNVIVTWATSDCLAKIAGCVQLHSMPYSSAVLTLQTSTPSVAGVCGDEVAQLVQHMRTSAAELLKVCQSFVKSYQADSHRDLLDQCVAEVASAKWAVLKIPRPTATVTGLRIVSFGELSSICGGGSISEAQRLYEASRVNIASSSDRLQVGDQGGSQELNRLEAHYQLFLLHSQLQRRLGSGEPRPQILRAVKLVAAKLSQTSQTKAAWSLVSELFEWRAQLGRTDDELIIFCAGLCSCFLEAPGTESSPSFKKILLPTVSFDWQLDRKSLRNLRTALKSNLEKETVLHPVCVADFVSSCTDRVVATHATKMSEWAERHLSEILLAGTLVELILSFPPFPMNYLVSYPFPRADAELLLGKSTACFALVALGSLASRRMTVLSDLQLSLLVYDPRLVDWNGHRGVGTSADNPRGAEMERRWLHSLFVFLELRVSALGESHFDESAGMGVDAGSFSGLCFDQSASLLQTGPAADASVLELLKGSPTSILSTIFTSRRDQYLRNVTFALLCQSRRLVQRQPSNDPTLTADLHRHLVSKKMVAIDSNGWDPPNGGEPPCLLDACDLLVQTASAYLKDIVGEVLQKSFAVMDSFHPWFLGCAVEPPQCGKTGSTQVLWMKETVERPYISLIYALVSPNAPRSVEDAIRTLVRQSVITDLDATVLMRVNSILQMSRQACAIAAYDVPFGVAPDSISTSAAELCYWAAVRPLARLAQKTMRRDNGSEDAVHFTRSAVLDAEFEETQRQDPNSKTIVCCWLSFVSWGLLSGMTPADFSNQVRQLPVTCLNIASLEELCRILRWLLEKSGGQWLNPSWEVWTRSVLSQVEALPTSTGECIRFIRGERKWLDVINSVFCVGKSPLRPVLKRSTSQSSEEPASIRVQVAFVSTADESPPVVEMGVGEELAAWWRRHGERSSSVGKGQPTGLKRGTSDSLFGRHTVIRVSTAVALEGTPSDGLYLRVRPELPGLECAVNILIRMVTGYIAAPYVDVWAFYRSQDESAIPVLVSTEARGPTLLEELKQSSAGRVENLHFASFCRLVLASMLINPEDGKEDNYIVTRDTTTKEAIIVAIDNDHSFVESFYETGIINTQRRLQLKCILFCFDEMTRPVHEDTLQFIERISISELMLRWLQRCQQSDRRLEALFPASTWTGLMAHPDEFTRTSVPMQMSQMAVAQVCDKLYRLQRLVQQFRKRAMGQAGGTLTLFDLLNAADPLVCQYYHRLVWNSNESVIDRFRQLTKEEYDIVDVTSATDRALSCSVTKSGVSRLLTKSFVGRDQNEPLQRLSTLLENFGRMKSKLADIDDITRRFANNDFKPFAELPSNEMRSLIAWRLNWGRTTRQTSPLSMWNGFHITAALKTIVDLKCNFERFQLRGYFLATDGDLVTKALQSMSFLVRFDCSESEAVDDSTFKVLSACCTQLNRVDARGCPHIQFIESRPLVGEKKPLVFVNLRHLDLSFCTRLQKCRIAAWNLQSCKLIGCPIKEEYLLKECWTPQCIFETDKGSTATNLSEHTGSVTSLAYLGDGMLASGSEDNTVRIWSLKDHRCAAVLKGHLGYVSSLVYVGDGVLASGSGDATVRLWNLKDGQCISTLKGYGMSTAATENARMATRAWSVKDLRHLAVLDGRNEYVSALSYLGDGRLASGSSTGALRIWNLKDGRCVNVLTGHNSHVLSLICLGDGLLASASTDTTVRVWNVKEVFCTRVLKGHTSSVASLVYLGDTRLASGSSDGTIRIWNVKSGECISVFDSDCGIVSSLSYLGNGLIASGSSTKLHVWDLEDKNNSFVLEGHIDTISSLSYLGSDVLVSVSSDGTMRVWNVKHRKCDIAFHVRANSIYALSCSGDMLAVGCRDQSVRLWNVKKNQVTMTMRGHTDHVSALLHIGDDLLASGSWDHTVRVWTLKDGRCSFVLTGHTGYVFSLVHLGDGLLASGSGDKTVRVWDVSTGQCVNKIEGYYNTASSAVYLGDDLLARSSEDYQVRVWNVKGARCVCSLLGHSDYVTSLAYLGNSLLASGSWDKTIRIWNVKSEVCVSVFKGHNDYVTSLACMGDSMLASGSIDGSIRVWNVRNGQCVHVLTGHSEYVSSLTSVDNHTLASGSIDGTVRFWNVKSGRCLRAMKIVN